MELQSHQAFYFTSLKPYSTDPQATFAVLRSHMSPNLLCLRPSMCSNPLATQP